MAVTGSDTKNQQMEVVAAAINVAAVSNSARIGSTTSSLVGFYGATPTSQRAGTYQASITHAVVVNSGSVSNTVYGYSTSAVADGIVLTLNEIRNALVAVGIIKGAE